VNPKPPVIAGVRTVITYWNGREASIAAAPVLIFMSYKELRLHPLVIQSPAQVNIGNKQADAVTPKNKLLF
jgi:hypothetical protein